MDRRDMRFALQDVCDTLKIMMEKRTIEIDRGNMDFMVIPQEIQTRLITPHDIIPSSKKGQVDDPSE